MTHSNKAEGSRSIASVAIMRENSSQVWFVVSHSSVVSTLRTARAFSRAADRHEAMDEALPVSRTMNCMTPSLLMWRCLLRYAPWSSLMPNTALQAASTLPARSGSNEVW